MDPGTVWCLCYVPFHYAIIEQLGSRRDYIIDITVPLVPSCMAPRATWEETAEKKYLVLLTEMQEQNGSKIE